MNYIGLCGILNLNRPRYGDAEPVVPGVQAADIGGGLMAVIGILGALLERNNNVDRKGQYIDISMLDTVFSFMPMAAALHFSRDLNDGIKSKNILHGDFPYYAIYRTRDNKFLSLGAIELKFWHDFCDRLGRKDLITKQTVTGEEKEHVFQEVQMELMKKNQAEWMEIFKGSDACVMPIKTFAEACQDPQIVARKMITTMKHPVFGNIENVSSPIKYSKTPLSIRSLAPKMGEHTEEILFSLDYTDEEIKNFKKRGII
jgi:crotonobetainyl-CoA:carnitine CoA-transferase CaiB-like acyl-CoA transferase